MSNSVTDRCWPLRMPPTAKAVLMSMADQANDEGYCWPSITNIAERTCVSARSVIDALKWLEESHCLEADRFNGRHTKYTLTPDLFVPSENKSMRTMKRQTASITDLGPVTMPHWSGVETHDDAALVPVTLPHQCKSRTGDDAAPPHAALSGVPMTMPHEPVTMPHTNHHEPSVEPPITIKEKHTVDLADLLSSFLEFWAAYPKKAAKPEAFKAWKRLKPDRELLDRILAALVVQKKTEDWRKDNKRFVPHPATYLNNERWLDEVEGGKSAAAAGGTPWYVQAGFENQWDAQNAQCHGANFHEFCDGKRIEQAEVLA